MQERDGTGTQGPAVESPHRPGGLPSLQIEVDEQFSQNIRNCVSDMP